MLDGSLNLAATGCIHLQHQRQRPQCCKKRAAGFAQQQQQQCHGCTFYVFCAPELAYVKMWLQGLERGSGRDTDVHAHRESIVCNVRWLCAREVVRGRGANNLFNTMRPACLGHLALHCAAKHESKPRTRHGSQVGLEKVTALLGRVLGGANGRVASHLYGCSL
eukprot:3841355-Amphidinium_carterae.1